MSLNTMTSEQLCESVSNETGGEAILAFFCGKDAIGSWLQMRRQLFDSGAPR